MSTNLLSASDNASSAKVSSESSNGRIIVASGTFGGGTLTLEYSLDGGTTWVATTLSLTAAGIIEFREQPGLEWRVTLAGATAGSVTADYV